MDLMDVLSSLSLHLPEDAYKHTHTHTHTYTHKARARKKILAQGRIHKRVSIRERKSEIE